MKIHNCSYFVWTVTFFSVIDKYFKAIHEVGVLKSLETCHLSQATEVDTFTSAVWFLVDLHCNKIRIGFFIFLEHFVKK